MAPVINFTLPAVQLVCNLVALGTPGINFTNSAVDLQSPPPSVKTSVEYSSTLPSLPAGYVPYPDIGVAYKVYRTEVSVIQARYLCAQESAHLAVIDSAKKVEYVGRLEPDEWVHTGIIRIDNTAWISINNGLVVSSIPWSTSNPYGSDNCAQFSLDRRGLSNFACETKAYYVCELPIPADSAISTN